ncbi:alpha/beta hydrolase [Rhodopirellula halodulae]|uniref:alpha/beta hydrolase n=1 Tax=Rhodopirellula halodulae TaxID=2894198 RepID=UPI001E35F1F7|nr:alpha/beta hydrolase-fold protein [Rhodopirellula sp. JC737]
MLPDHPLRCHATLCCLLGFTIVCSLNAVAGTEESKPIVLREGMPHESRHPADESTGIPAATLKTHFALPASATTGAYVRGSIRGAGSLVWLTNPNGEPIRQLARGEGILQTFHFVVDDPACRLSVSGPPSSEYALSVDSIIPLSDQRPPSPSLQSPRLAELRSHLQRGKSTDAFWRSLRDGGTPLIEEQNTDGSLSEHEVLVTFLYRGAKRNVRLFGAPSGDHDELTRLGDSDVWYGSYVVSKQARIDYRLAPDVPVFDADYRQRRRAILATAQRDPLNPNHEPANPTDIYDGVSVVTLPDAPSSHWSQASASTPNNTLLKGSVQTIQVHSDILNNDREVHLYRPVSYQPNAADNAMLIVFDGNRYLEDVRLPTILDNLIAANKIPPTAAVLVTNPDPKQRGIELPCNEDFVRFLTDELMPVVHARSLHASRERTVLVGASYGGLASSFAALKAPEKFGNVLSQSGSYWWSPGGEFGRNESSEPNWLIRQYVQSKRQPVRFVLQAGTFELPSNILPDNRHFRNCLEAKGYDVQYSEFVGGHGYFHWRHALPDGLMRVLPTP